MSENNITDPRLQIGGNYPPLAEQLTDEIEPLSTRCAELVEIAGTARILDDESAQKVSNLAVMLRELQRDLDDARTARLRPFAEATRMINAAYGAPIGRADASRRALMAMLTEHERQREAAAAAERARLAAEQRQRQAEADAARRAADEAAAAGQRSTKEELAALKAADDAEALARRAAAIRPEPIRATLGTVGTRREIAWNVVNLRATIGWMLKQPPLMAVLAAHVRQMVGQYLRQIGVDAVERGVEIPGVESWIEKQAGIRR